MFDVVGLREMMKSIQSPLPANIAEEQAFRHFIDNMRCRNLVQHQQNQVADPPSQSMTELSARSSDQASITRILHELDETRAALSEVRKELGSCRSKLSEKETEMLQLEIQFEKAKDWTNDIEENHRSILDKAGKRVHDLETSLSGTVTELRSQKEMEKNLSKSLKEALKLLRPMQMHLAKAEVEKKKMAAELIKLKKQLDSSNSVPCSSLKMKDKDLRQIQDLKYAMRQLQQKNTQLEDALEDMSHRMNVSQAFMKSCSSQKNKIRLKEQFSDIKGLHEVTKERLQDALLENRSLVEALRKSEKREHLMLEELEVLRTKVGDLTGNDPSSELPNSEQLLHSHNSLEQQSNDGILC